MAATYAEVATLTQRVADREIENRALRQRVTELRRTLHIPAWCGCTTEYVPVPVRGGGGNWCRSGTQTR
jgi:hypothetical protein